MYDPIILIYVRLTNRSQTQEMLIFMLDIQLASIRYSLSRNQDKK